MDLLTFQWVRKDNLRMFIDVCVRLKSVVPRHWTSLGYRGRTIIGL